MYELKTARAKIEGVAPLLMSNPRMVDENDELKIQFKAITDKHHTKRTKADMEKKRKLEYLGGIYENKTDGVYLPCTNIEACIRDGARTKKKGKTIESGLSVSPNCVKLIYDGPKTGKALYKDGRFVDYRSVVINKNRVMKIRPRFDNWALEFEIMAVAEIVSLDDVQTFLSIAGIEKGLGDFRPKFGRFIVKEFYIV